MNPTVPFSPLFFYTPFSSSSQASRVPSSVVFSDFSVPQLWPWPETFLHHHSLSTTQLAEHPASTMTTSGESPTITWFKIRHFSYLCFFLISSMFNIFYLKTIDAIKQRSLDKLSMRELMIVKKLLYSITVSFSCVVSFQEDTEVRKWRSVFLI